MIKYLKYNNGFEKYCLEIGRTNTIDVTEYCTLGDNEVVCGGFTFKVKRDDKPKFKNCTTAEEFEELFHSYGYDVVNKIDY